MQGVERFMLLDDLGLVAGPALAEQDDLGLDNRALPAADSGEDGAVHRHNVGVGAGCAAELWGLLIDEGGELRVVVIPGAGVVIPPGGTDEARCDSGYEAHTTAFPPASSILTGDGRSRAALIRHP